MAKFHQFRTHFDQRRNGRYDIIPILEGDLNFTFHFPKIIPKELHMHKKQTDYFIVAKGKVMFRLVNKKGKEEKFVITENDNKTVIIKPNTWHGYVALEESIMIFYITHKYDAADEFRKKTKTSEWKLT